MEYKELIHVIQWKMRSLQGSKIIAVVLSCWLLSGCKEQVAKKASGPEDSSRVAHLPYYNEESFTPHWLTPDSPEEKSFHKIPDFQFINQLGDTISQKTFDNKIYIADFFFTSCPGICTKMTGNMAKVQEAFLNDPEVVLLSHSVTPSIDSVSVLKNYAKNHGVQDNKWHLVTGDRTAIYELGRNHYFVENDLGVPKDPNDFLHTENFLLVDKNKHIRGIYNGLNRASINQLITDIRTLLEES